MTEKRFLNLKDALIHHGVAMQHARRAALEMEDHYRQLVEEALAHDKAPEDAWRIAHDVLGTNTAVIEQYASRRELRGALYRWPVLCALAPLGSFVVLCATTMAALVLTLQTFSHTLHHFVVPQWLAEAINFSIGIALQWTFPVVVAGGFALFARRRRIAFGWLIAGALLVCLVAQQMNVGLVLPTVGHRGSASMGIGFGLATFPDHVAWAIGMAALALAPYCIVTFRSQLGRMPLA